MTEIIKKLLYGGSVEIDFYPVSHQYRKNKKILDSVTSISGIIDKSRILMQWVAKVAEETGNPYGYLEKQDTAKNIGTEVHDFCEKFVKYRLGELEGMPEVPVSHEGVNGAISFMEWVNNNSIVFLKSERLVYSKEHNYVGITDVIFKMNGLTYLGDFKTSKAYYPVEMRLQTEGYKIAYEEETGVKIDRKAIIRLDKETGEFEFIDIPEDDREAFLTARKLKSLIKLIK